MMEITPRLSIPPEEITFTFSRSGGPGGQNVNKVNTRATLWFDVQSSPSLTEEQRRRIHEKLHTRIDSRGVMRVVAHRHRTQKANREASTERFVQLLQWALHRDPPRKKTRVPNAAKRKRLESKRRRAQIKQQRSRNIKWDG